MKTGKKDSFIFLIAEVTLVLLLALLSAFLPESTIRVEGSEIAYAFEDENAIVYSGGRRDLGPGTYTVDFYYRTAGENNTYRFSYEFEDISAIRYDRGIALDPKKTKQTATLTLTSPVHGFDISIYQKSAEGVYLDHVDITQTNRGLRVFAVCLLVLFAVIDLILYWHDRTKDNGIFVAAAIGLLACLPLTVGFYTGGHDLTFHLYRIEGIKDALLSGQFPVRIHPTAFNGYSSPTALYYPELFLFLPAVLRIAGVGVHASFQIMLALIHMGTACISYTAFLKISKNKKIALLVCSLYTWNFYRLEIVHYRYAVGEALAMMLMPLFVMAFLQLVETTESTFRSHRKNILLLILVCSLILQSHLLSCYLLVPVGIVLMIVYAKELIRNRSWIDIGISVFVTILLNAWFLLPLYEATGLNYYMKSWIYDDIGEDALFFVQIFFPTGEMDGVTETVLDGIKGEMPFTIGLAASILFFALIALIPVIFKKRREYPKQAKLFFTSLCITLIALFVCTNMFPWYIAREGLKIFTKLMGVIQFPWRFLTIAVLFECIAAIAAVSCIKKEEYCRYACYTAAVLSLITLFIFNQKILQSDIPRRSYEESVKYRNYITKDYMNINTDIHNIPSEEELLANPYIVSYHKNGSNIEMEINNTSEYEQPINVSLFLFPGYVARDDAGNTLTMTNGTDELIAVLVPPGYHQNVKISVKEKPLWIAGDITTIVVILGLIAFALFPVRKKSESGQVNN